MISVHPELIWTKPKPPAPIKAIATTKLIDGAAVTVNVPVRRFAVKAAYAGADTFRQRGGMSGGPTGGNGSVGRFADVVPRAFVR